MAIRLGLLTVAVIVCAWFALGIRASHDAGVVSAILQAHNNPTPAEAAKARSALGDAEVLNPDQNLQILRAQIEFHSGNVAAGISIAKSVVKREPLNVSAWLVLELFTRQADPALNRLAQERVSQLVPPVRVG
jgi:hypothetical protein